MKLKGKKYGKLGQSSAGLSSGLTEASRFTPSDSNPKTIKSNDRPLKEAPLKAH